METVWLSAIHEVTKFGLIGYVFVLVGGVLLIAWTALQVVLAVLRRMK